MACAWEFVLGDTHSCHHRLRARDAFFCRRRHFQSGSLRACEGGVVRQLTAVSTQHGGGENGRIKKWTLEADGRNAGCSRTPGAIGGCPGHQPVATAPTRQGRKPGCQTGSARRQGRLPGCKLEEQLPVPARQARHEAGGPPGKTGHQVLARPMLADETMLRIRAAAFWRGPVHAQPANYGYATALSGRHSNVGFFLKVLLESGYCDCPGLNGSSGSGTIAGCQRASDRDR